MNTLRMSVVGAAVLNGLALLIYLSFGVLGLVVFLAVVTLFAAVLFPRTWWAGFLVIEFVGILIRVVGAMIEFVGYLIASVGDHVAERGKLSKEAMIAPVKKSSRLPKKAGGRSTDDSTSLELPSFLEDNLVH